MPAQQNPKTKKWRFRKMVEGVNLRSRYIYLTKKAADLAEAEAVDTFSKTGQIITQPPKVNEAQTISELFAKRVDWLEQHRSPRYASNMDSLFTRALDLAPRYASTSVLSIGIEAAQQMIDELRLKWTAKSIGDFIRYAQAAWNHPWGSRRSVPTFPHNPWQYIERPAQEYKIKYVPTREEVNLIRMAAAGEFRLWLEIEIETGARVGEALTLAWEDVGPDYVVLHTRKSAGGHRRPRKLSISQDLADRFKSWRKGQDAALYVFQQAGQDKPRRKVWVRKHLARACKAAKVKVFPPGSFRHYRASLWAAEGVPLTTIQARLGHSKATTTDNYLRELKAR